MRTRPWQWRRTLFAWCLRIAWLAANRSRAASPPCSRGYGHAGCMSGRLPSVRAREVIRALERAGFAVSRISGSHCRLVHPTDGSIDLKRGTLRGIITQAGLTVAEFTALL